MHSLATKQQLMQTAIKIHEIRTVGIDQWHTNPTRAKEVVKTTPEDQD